MLMKTACNRAFNVNNGDSSGNTEAAKELNAPLILQVPRERKLPRNLSHEALDAALEDTGLQ